MRGRRAGRHGIALMLVLVILLILSTLTGAFIGINHQNFALMASSIDQEKATSACYAGYNYAFWSLEHDRNWGKDNFDDQVPFPTAQDRSDLSGLLTIQAASPNTLFCELLDEQGRPTQGTVQIEVRNAVPPSSDVDPAPPLPGVAGVYPDVDGNCVFLRITGTSGGVTRRLETLFNVAPLYGASATSNGAMDINAQNKLMIDSRDKYRNLVRSNGDISFLNAVGPTNRLKFDWSAWAGDPVMSTLARKGTVIANGDITAYGKSMSTKGNETLKADIEASARGLLAPKSERSNPIYEIESKDFRMSSDPNVAKVPIKEGTYVFGNMTYQVSYETFQAVEWDDDGNPTDFDWVGNSQTNQYPALVRQVGTSLEEVWVSGDFTPVVGFPMPGVGGTTRVTNVAPSIVTKIPPHMDPDGIVDLADIAESGLPAGVTADRVRVDVGKADFRVSKDLLLTSKGDFGVTSEARGSVPWWAPSAETDAKLYLGVDFVTGQAQTRPGGIQAAGSINVREVYGRGALVANKNLTVQAGGVLTTDPNVSLALYAGNNVTMDPNILTSAGYTGVVETYFKGLVYAGNNFEVRTPGYMNPKKLTIEGALVARNGSINITDAEEVNLIYNPLYISKNLSDRPDRDIKLDRQAFNFR